MTALHQIKDGDVLAFKSKGFWSAAIRLRTQARVSHVGFAVWAWGQLCVFEARERIGVRVWPLADYLRRPGYEVEHYELLEGQYGIDRECVIDGAAQSFADAYAHPLQFLRSWGWITRWLCDRWGVPPDTDASRWHCSEFVSRKLIDAGLETSVLIVPAMTSPGDIVEFPCLHRTGSVKS